MKPESKERVERLGPIRGIPRVPSGSPVEIVIRPMGELSQVRRIDLAKALAKRGMSLLKAKRTMEEMVDGGVAYALVPTVESIEALISDLAAAGVRAKRLGQRTIDVKALRERLGLTQEQFSLRYALALDAVRNWEQGRTRPDAGAMAYLRAIARLPREVAEAQEEVLTETSQAAQ